MQARFTLGETRTKSTSLLVFVAPVVASMTTISCESLRATISPSVATSASLAVWSGSGWLGTRARRSASRVPRAPRRRTPLSRSRTLARSSSDSGGPGGSTSGRGLPSLEPISTDARPVSPSHWRLASTGALKVVTSASRSPSASSRSSGLVRSSCRMRTVRRRPGTRIVAEVGRCSRSTSSRGATARSNGKLERSIAPNERTRTGPGRSGLESIHRCSSGPDRAQSRNSARPASVFVRAYATLRDLASRFARAAKRSPTCDRMAVR